MSDAERPSWAMGGITERKVEQYLYALLPERDEVLREMEQQARQRRIPIVGPLVGRLLYQLARISGARTVFEMGSAIGYSTVWWARALGDGGRVVYTDGDRKNADEARRYFERAGVAGRVQIKVGDALEILSEYPQESLDIVFNDVDKEDYPRVFRLAVSRLRKGGLFVSDNALWHGDVAQPVKAQNESTRAVVQFNSLLYNSPELFTTILPLRDGVAVAIKI